MLNRIILIGRLTRDPELRYTQSGKAVANFTLAVDRQFKDQNGNKQTDFIDCVVWDKAAESCGKYLAKGSMAACDGRLQLRSYDDKDGNKRRVTEVVADNVRFLSPKKDSGQSQDGNTAYQEPPENVHEMTSFDDDPPF